MVWCTFTRSFTRKNTIFDRIQKWCFFNESHLSVGEILADTRVKSQAMQPSGARCRERQGSGHQLQIFDLASWSGSSIR